MHKRLLSLVAATAVLCCACQPTAISVASQQLAAAQAYLSTEQTKFQQSATQLLEKHLATYRNRGGRGQVGIYLLELASGFSAGYQADKTLRLPTGEDIGYFNTASVAKLPMAFVAYALHDQGRIDLDQPHYDQVTGQTWDLRPMIHRMLTHSINDYYNILLRMIGPQLAQATLAACGMPDTRLSRELQPAVGASDANCLQRYGTLLAPRTTPQDLGQLLAALYRGDVLSPESNAAMLDALQHTEYNSRIPAGIAYASSVAHKTGTSPEERVYNDAALVLLAGNPFVLTIQSKDASSHVTRTMRELAADLYALEQSRVQAGTIAGIVQAVGRVNRSGLPLVPADALVVPRRHVDLEP